MQVEWEQMLINYQPIHSGSNPDLFTKAEPAFCKRKFIANGFSFDRVQGLLYGLRFYAEPLFKNIYLINIKNNKMEINIEDYLSHDEVKEIVIDRIRAEVAKLFNDEENAKRILSNLSYQIVFDEVDKIIPNSKDVICQKTVNVINSKDFSFNVFRKGDAWSKASSAYLIMENTIKENKHLIEEKVKSTIENRDYTDDVWAKFEELGETFISNIYEIVRLGRQKK